MRQKLIWRDDYRIWRDDYRGLQWAWHAQWSVHLNMTDTMKSSISALLTHKGPQA